ncbi:hypothetical protein AYI68_g7732 [Smittium mucronatum]|uniref:Uncharacterized protein n=1 Tax=Smittium mucronatum TaxID=133383 RepID=A0A1R0GMV0_9FUNG|nr:hypothetical protein AYI68_g7732 [Smittium mucronatum]
MVKKYLLDNSMIGNKVYLIKNGENVSVKVPIYYLESTRNEIYKEMIRENKDLEIDINSFYKMRPKNFKNPMRKK